MANSFDSPEFGTALDRSHKEIMTLTAAHMPYLADPERIDESVLDTPVAYGKQEPHGALAQWLTQEFVDATNLIIDEVPFKEICDEGDLDKDTRRVIELVPRKLPRELYHPGIYAVSHLLEVIPFVAQRDGINRNAWGQIAHDSKSFGRALAARSTFQQTALRHLWGLRFDGNPHLNPRNFVIADGVLTTSTPEDEVFGIVAQMFDEHWNGDTNTKKRCPAMSLRVAGHDDTVFNETWDAMASVTSRFIYPETRLPKSASKRKAFPPIRPDVLSELVIEAMIKVEAEAMTQTSFV